MNSHLDWFSVTYVLWRHHVKHFAFLFFIKQINSMLPRVCSVIDNRRLRNKAKKIQWHTWLRLVSHSFVLTPFDGICGRQLNKPITARNLFVQFIHKRIFKRSGYLGLKGDEGSLITSINCFHLN